MWKVDLEVSAKLAFARDHEMDGAEPYKLVSSLRLNEPIENFCFVEKDGKLLVLVANGNLISICEVESDSLE